GVSGVTKLLTLNAVSDQSIILGDQGVGPAIAGQYVLNEDGEIRADSIVINALSAGEGPAPDILVYDVGINGEYIDDVTLNTDSSIFVDGTINYFNAGSGDSLTLNAGQNIEVNTDTGGIQMT